MIEAAPSAATRSISGVIPFFKKVNIDMYWFESVHVDGIVGNENCKQMINIIANALHAGKLRHYSEIMFRRAEDSYYLVNSIVKNLELDEQKGQYDFDPNILAAAKRARKYMVQCLFCMYKNVQGAG